ncbi:hypothetical protein CPB84DRAFT_1927065 [Gymnopilus junonius]|uniref:Uncharacterized protein n=1 Tax=Gymnopilus junonius TaxID=109634 RepID=A0A9P5NP17_GYMJU|nr:hypothetical protein CPB84DRAFT_1927065 [Gymnopilus junonius]
MGFCPKGLWVMGYGGLMGFWTKIPVHRVGGPKKVWVLWGYGLSRSWVMRVPTVVSWGLLNIRILFPPQHSVCHWARVVRSGSMATRSGEAIRTVQEPPRRRRARGDIVQAEHL